MKAAALLLGAGRGERTGSREPKAFLRMGGMTLLERAARTVDACPEVGWMAIVVPPGREEEAVRAGVEAMSTPGAVVPGGATRQASVRLAMEALSAPFWESRAQGEEPAALPPEVEAVVCHDVARPLATPELFSRVLTALEGADGVVPGVPVSDTIKRVRGSSVTGTVVRDDLVLAQTPQAFRRSVLEEAHAAADRDGIEATDDAALVERIGGTVVVVPGDPTNLKVTVPSDVVLCEALLGGDHR